MAKRVYISDEAYVRLKKFAAEKHLKLRDALDYLIMNSIDRDGSKKVLNIDPKVADIISSWASQIGITESELLFRMIKTIRILYDERLSLARALKSIPQLEKELFGSF